MTRVDEYRTHELILRFEDRAATLKYHGMLTRVLNYALGGNRKGPKTLRSPLPGGTTTDKFGYIFASGLMALTQLIDIEQSIEEGEGVQGWDDWLAEDRLKHAMEMATYEDRFKSIDEKGLDWYMENAETRGHDYTEDMKMYELRNMAEEKKPKPPPRWSEVVADWLTEELASGDECNIKDIRQKAEAQGIICSNGKDVRRSNKEWATLRVIAGRMGASSTGRRGYWQLRIE